MMHRLLMAFTFLVASVLVAAHAETAAELNERLHSNCGTLSGTAEGYSLAITQWTGGCMNGKRDGTGLLEEQYPGIGSPMVMRFQTTYVAGKQVGLRCLLPDKFSIYEKCFGGGPGIFTRMEDRSWRAIESDGVLIEGITLPAGTLEQVSDAAIADARAGRTPKAQAVTADIEAFADLVPSGKVKLVTNVPSSVQGKRVAIILSTRTIAELDRFGKEREAFMKLNPLPSNADEKPPQGFAGGFFSMIEKSVYSGADDVHPVTARDYFDNFAKQSETSMLGRSIASAIIQMGGTPVAANDLSILKTGGADFALVVDWRYQARFDLTAKAFKRLDRCKETIPKPGECKDSTIFSSAYGLFLVSPSIEVVRVRGARTSIPKFEDEDAGYDPYRALFAKVKKPFPTDILQSFLR